MNINGKSNLRQGLTKSASRDGRNKFVNLQRKSLSRIYDRDVNKLEKRVSGFV